MHVPNKEVHNSENRMLSHDVRRRYYDVRNRARRNYEGLEVEVHGNALVISHDVRMTHNQMMLKEKRDLQLFTNALDVAPQQDCTEVYPVVAIVDSSVCLGLPPSFAPENAEQYSIQCVSPNNTVGELRLKNYTMNMLFFCMANVVVALIVIGLLLGSAIKATGSALRTGGIYGDEGNALLNDFGSSKHFVYNIGLFTS